MRIAFAIDKPFRFQETPMVGRTHASPRRKYQLRATDFGVRQCSNRKRHAAERSSSSITASLAGVLPTLVVRSRNCRNYRRDRPHDTEQASGLWCGRNTWCRELSVCAPD